MSSIFQLPTTQTLHNLTLTPKSAVISSALTSVRLKAFASSRIPWDQTRAALQSLSAGVNKRRRRPRRRSSCGGGAQGAATRHKASGVSVLHQRRLRMTPQAEVKVTTTVCPQGRKEKLEELRQKPGLSRTWETHGASASCCFLSTPLSVPLRVCF